jgi:aspartate/methionine/tyrosine aminotransferase
MADDVRQLITDKTRLVIINSPSNPTGAMTEQKEIEEIYILR